MRNENVVRILESHEKVNDVYMNRQKTNNKRCFGLDRLSLDYNRSFAIDRSLLLKRKATCQLEVAIFPFH